jgi:hypothetical protein
METEKLYSPLAFYLHDPRQEEEDGEYGVYGLYDDRYRISHEEANEHIDAVELAFRRDRDRMDAARGMAQYLVPPLSGKVLSMFPTIELHGSQYYCVAGMKLTGPLTPEELSELKEWWCGQLSDGWGEGFEQRAITVGRKELYVVPWTSDDSVFFIDTQRELYRRLGLAPIAAARVTVDPPAPPSASAIREPLVQRREDGTTSVRDTLRRSRETPQNPKPEQPGRQRTGFEL